MGFQVAGISNTSLAADFIRRINVKEEQQCDEHGSTYLDEKRVKEVMTSIHLGMDYHQIDFFSY